MQKKPPKLIRGRITIRGKFFSLSLKPTSVELEISSLVGQRSMNKRTNSEFVQDMEIQSIEIQNMEIKA
jgi:hypothetical protein